MRLHFDAHLFFSENNFVRNGEVIKKYLGFENDILFFYKPNSFTGLQVGYSWAQLTESMGYIKKTGNPGLWQDWAYVMVTFKPELFKWGK